MATLRMDRECDFECPQCKGKPYTLYRRQNLGPDGSPGDSYSNVFWLGPDGQGLLPPADTKNLVCPNDGTPLQRRY